MADPNIEAEFNLTDRYQTTIPEGVMRALGGEQRERFVYSGMDNRWVLISRYKEGPAPGPNP